jgi:hypothetical protein
MRQLTTDPDREHLERDRLGLPLCGFKCPRKYPHRLGTPVVDLYHPQPIQGASRGTFAIPTRSVNLKCKQVFSDERRTMPMQYVQSFLLVAEEEGLGATEYAQRADVSVSVMSRHLLDIGERDRYMEPGLGWVAFRLNPMELRKKEYFLTDKGRALVHQFKRQLSK